VKVRKCERGKGRDGGLYVLLIRLPRRRRIRIGRLGVIDFDAGWYLYIGSAQRNRAARLARHARRAKRLHWHVDYLLAAARLAATFEVAGDGEAECHLAAHLSAALGLPRRPPRMGASDCRCGGHVLYAAKRPAVAGALRTWPPASSSHCRNRQGQTRRAICG